MMQNPGKAEQSWKHYRSAFDRRSHHFPALAVFVRLIDKICELGYSERLYAGASLDNLVISVLPEPHDRRQTILVIPHDNAVEFRLYPADGAAEISAAAPEQAASAIEKLLIRLIGSDKTSSGGAAQAEANN